MTDQKIQRPEGRRVTGQMRIPAHEKRKHPRHPLREIFRCFIGGQKVLSLALDQGGGGAFLALGDPPAPGTVMVVEVEADLQQRQVFLVAEVMRRQLTPIKGVGVRWLRAVGLDTEKSLLTFVEHHLRLAPGSIRGTARFAPGPGERPVIDFEARVLRVMTRAAQEAELAMLMSRSVAPAVEVDDAAFDPPPGVPPPIPEDTVEDMPEVLEQEATDGLGMRRLDTEIFYRFGGQQHRGILRFASSMRFVLDSSSPLTGRNGRLYVEWNDRGGAGGVVLRGEVEREILSPSGTWRVEARITALSEGGRPGLYREYLIKYGV